MKRIISLIWNDKRLMIQFALVFVAFLVMIVIGSVFGARIVNRNVASYGEGVINSSAETLNASFSQYKIILDDISFSVGRLQEEGAGYDEYLQEFVEWSDYWMENEDGRLETFTGMYGVLEGQYVDGVLWEPPAGYDPETRPWYIGAVAAQGETFFSNPYVDANSGEYVMSVSKLILDKEGQPLGVVATDVFIANVSEFVKNLNLMGSGYGMLLDSEGYILTHPDGSLVGLRMENINDGQGGYGEIGSILAENQSIQAYPFVAYTGLESVAFFKQLFNGWYVGIVSPSSDYYNDVDTMGLILSAAGFGLMLLLCAMLAWLHIEKNRSDEANRIKTSFLANMSHEIRTPMNSIIGMSDLLMNENLSYQQRDYVHDINMSAHSLLSIINDILDLSKIEAGKLELNPVDYDFQVFIDNINSMFHYVARKKHLEFFFETEGDLPKCLYGDDIRLRQVLTNICGNGVKFTSQGYIRLRVTATNESISFEIKDTGLGIKKEDMPKLFDPFAQADMAKNRNITGTGLGLSISKTFVEMMGGQISVSSVYGHGSTFTVTLPRVEGDQAALRPADKDKQEKSFIAPEARVLVVDDNDVNLKVVAGLLGLFKITPVTASSGQEAIDLVRGADFDIVFMDHMMPEMDGLEAAAEIRKIKEMTIVALTANAVRGAKEMYLNNGFNDFISKPIDLRELGNILRRWLPREIVTVARAEETAVTAVSTFVRRLQGIAEINTEIGLSLVTGLEDMYITTMGYFHKALPPECSKMQGFLDNNQMADLAISVHGMKSSLATVGAMELSALAYELEKAAKADDEDYCRQHFPPFLEKLSRLHENLSAVMDTEENDKPSQMGDNIYLRQQVQEAISAANAFDGDALEGIISNLLNYDFGKDANVLLKEAEDAVRNFDFDAATNRLYELENM